MEKMNNHIATNELVSISTMTLYNLINELENHKKQMNNLQNRIQDIENAIKNLNNKNHK